MSATSHEGAGLAAVEVRAPRFPLGAVTVCDDGVVPVGTVPFAVAFLPAAVGVTPPETEEPPALPPLGTIVDVELVFEEDFPLPL